MEVGMEVGASDKIVATTKVLIPQGDGPIKATSVITAIPQSESDGIQSVDTVYDTNSDHYNKPSANEYVLPSKRRSMKAQEDYHMPSAPTLHEINSNPKLLLNLQGRQHAFGSKSFVISDSCIYCSKR